MSISRDRAHQLFAGACSNKVLVVGDVMVDRIDFPDSSSSLLGGAANVAANIRTLGGQAQLVGVYGRDPEGDALVCLIQERGISNSLTLDPERPTTLKIRKALTADGPTGPQVSREDTSPIRDGTLQMLRSRLNSGLWTAGAIVVSDYAKGVVIPEVYQQCISTPVQTIVDPKPKPDRLIGFYRAPGIILVPNEVESRALLGGAILPRKEDAVPGWELRDQSQARAVVVTRGPLGMEIFPRAGLWERHPALSLSVVSEVGAGDTAKAAMALMIASGATLSEAVMVANIAAGIAVSKPGTATVSAEEVIQYCS